MKTLDVNADLGEGSFPDSLIKDVELMKYITSVNIACGMHAGNPFIMRETVKNALELTVSIGAHPGYDDPKNFGRKSMSLSKEELEASIYYQVGALKTIVEAQGGKLRHVKPHGALYNDMANDYEKAMIVAYAIQKVDASLIFVGLANSVMMEAGKEMGLVTVHEVFADRAYLNSGLLVPRSDHGAVLHNPETGIRQVKNMVLDGFVTSIKGKEIKIQADTVCVHGDNPDALDFVKLLHAELRKEKVELKAMGKR